MGSLSPVHWVIVLLVVVLLFGPSRLSKLGKELGEGIGSFKKGIAADDDKKPTAEKRDA